MNVSVAELKADLSKILRRAAAGEEIVVTRHGKPVVKIAKADAMNREEIIAKRRAFIGSLKGKGYWIADDFDDPLPEFEEYM